MNYSLSYSDDEEEQKKQAEGGGDSAGGVPTASPTFAMLQKQGYPRPPQPTLQPGAAEAGGVGSPLRNEPVRRIEDSGGGGGGGGSQPPTPIGPTQPGGPTTQPPPTPGWPPGGPTTPPGVPTGTAGQTQTPFGRHLQGQYEGYQMPGAFQGGYQPLSGPQYQPGAGPMNVSQSMQMVPQGYSPQNFYGQAPGAFTPQSFQGQYSAVQSPLMRQTGQFTPQGGGLDSQLQSAISGQLQNPSMFNQQAVQDMYNRLSGQIDDEYSVRNQRLEEDMARRGLADSSIRGGRLADLNVEKRSAKTELGDRLLERMATTGGADRNAAISQAMGYGGQQFSQGLQGYQANQGANQQNFQQDLAQRAFQGDQQAMQLIQNMGIAGFNNQAGQQGFQNQLQGTQMGMDIQGFNNAAGQQGFTNQLNSVQLQNQFGNDAFARQLQASQFNQGLGQSQFNNQLAAQNFNAGQQQQGYTNQLTNFQANLGAGQQGFNQQQALLASLLGYEQQGFENAFQGAQFQADNDFRNRQLAAAMASLGL